ncbi:Hybrid signal transduction histidine kinase D [Smittium mucronatum]|uniref:histidine kinase n=1 Tax=Smittium mucronatum TaxID=133383 RepID=A0A1R0H5G7_9FUNG|nr:Hybrid signal transduction histidine kinase D [Smittium mucronatum]
MKVSVKQMQLVSQLSHELRTPISAIIGWNELLMEDGQLNSNQRKNMGHIHYASVHLLDLLNTILDVSKLGANKMQLQISHFNLHQLVYTVAQMLVGSTIESNIELLVDYPRNVPQEFYGDPGRIRQIIINLLSNSIKFTSSGGEVKIVVRCLASTPRKSFIEIRVEDTGCGIPIELHSLLFREFVQVGGNESKNSKLGTGLGLYLVKNLTTMMEGKVWVKSMPNVGSVFGVRLPLPIKQDTLGAYDKISPASLINHDLPNRSSEVNLSDLGEYGDELDPEIPLFSNTLPIFKNNSSSSFKVLKNSFFNDNIKENLSGFRENSISEKDFQKIPFFSHHDINNRNGVSSPVNALAQNLNFQINQDTLTFLNSTHFIILGSSLRFTHFLANLCKNSWGSKNVNVIDLKEPSSKSDNPEFHLSSSKIHEKSNIVSPNEIISDIDTIPTFLIELTDSLEFIEWDTNSKKTGLTKAIHKEISKNINILETDFESYYDFSPALFSISEWLIEAAEIVIQSKHNKQPFFRKTNRDSFDCNHLPFDSKLEFCKDANFLEFERKRSRSALNFISQRSTEIFLSSVNKIKKHRSFENIQKRRGIKVATSNIQINKLEDNKNNKLGLQTSGIDSHYSVSSKPELYSVSDSYDLFDANLANHPTGIKKGLLVIFYGHKQIKLSMIPPLISYYYSIVLISKPITEPTLLNDLEPAIKKLSDVQSIFYQFSKKNEIPIKITPENFSLQNSQLFSSLDVRNPSDDFSSSSPQNTNSKSIYQDKFHSSGGISTHKSKIPSKEHSNFLNNIDLDSSSKSSSLHDYSNYKSYTSKSGEFSREPSYLLIKKHPQINEITNKKDVQNYSFNKSPESSSNYPDQISLGEFINSESTISKSANLNRYLTSHFIKKDFFGSTETISQLRENLQTQSEVEISSEKNFLLSEAEDSNRKEVGSLVPIHCLRKPFHDIARLNFEAFGSSDNSITSNSSHELHKYEIKPKRASLKLKNMFYSNQKTPGIDLKTPTISSPHQHVKELVKSSKLKRFSVNFSNIFESSNIDTPRIESKSGMAPCNSQVALKRVLSFDSYFRASQFNRSVVKPPKLQVQKKLKKCNSRSEIQTSSYHVEPPEKIEHLTEFSPSTTSILHKKIDPHNFFNHSRYVPSNIKISDTLLNSNSFQATPSLNRTLAKSTKDLYDYIYQDKSSPKNHTSGSYKSLKSKLNSKFRNSSPSHLTPKKSKSKYLHFDLPNFNIEKNFPESEKIFSNFNIHTNSKTENCIETSSYNGEDLVCRFVYSDELIGLDSCYSDYELFNNNKNPSLQAKTDIRNLSYTLSSPPNSKNDGVIGDFSQFSTSIKASNSHNQLHPNFYHDSKLLYKKNQKLSYEFFKDGVYLISDLVPTRNGLEIFNVRTKKSSSNPFLNKVSFNSQYLFEYLEKYTNLIENMESPILNNLGYFFDLKTLVFANRGSVLIDTPDPIFKKNNEKSTSFGNNLISDHHSFALYMSELLSKIALKYRFRTEKIPINKPFNSLPMYPDKILKFPNTPNHKSKKSNNSDNNVYSNIYPNGKSELRSLENDFRHWSAPTLLVSNVELDISCNFNKLDIESKSISSSHHIHNQINPKDSFYRSKMVTLNQKNSSGVIPSKATSSRIHLKSPLERKLPEKSISHEFFESKKPIFPLKNTQNSINDFNPIINFKNLGDCPSDTRSNSPNLPDSSVSTNKKTHDTSSLWFNPQTSHYHNKNFESDIGLECLKNPNFNDISVIDNTKTKMLNKGKSSDLEYFEINAFKETIGHRKNSFSPKQKFSNSNLFKNKNSLLDSTGPNNLFNHQGLEFSESPSKFHSNSNSKPCVSPKKSNDYSINSSKHQINTDLERSSIIDHFGNKHIYPDSKNKNGYISTFPSKTSIYSSLLNSNSSPRKSNSSRNSYKHIFKENESLTMSNTESGTDAYVKRKSLRILVADDSSPNRMLLVGQLKKLGIKDVDSAADGVVACNLFEPGKYYLIFMDIQMPQVDGYQATKYIRQVERDQLNISDINCAIYADSKHNYPNDTDHFAKNNNGKKYIYSKNLSLIENLNNPKLDKNNFLVNTRDFSNNFDKISDSLSHWNRSKIRSDRDRTQFTRSIILALSADTSVKDMFNNNSNESIMGFDSVYSKPMSLKDLYSAVSFWLPWYEFPKEIVKKYGGGD